MAPKIKILIIFCLIALSLFTRFWQLNSYPTALFSDEVDAGYQAYVFNQQGTDYFGNYLPIHFHSFSDWRTSAYIYSIAVMEKFTTNQELAVRLPSAIFSSLTILVFYLITGSTFATFLLIISPWAIHYGRTGFEVSGMLLVIFLGIYFWQKYLKLKQDKYLFLSGLFFCLSPYFYSTAKLFLPLILLAVLIVWFKEIIKIKPLIVILLTIFLGLILTPILVDTINGHSGFRFSYIGIFTEPHREQITDQLRYEDIYTSNLGKIGVKTPLISSILHNKYELVGETFITNYFSSFSTEYLFLKGDTNLRQGFGNHGMLYLIDFFLLISGLVIFFKSPSKLGSFFFILLILAPIPFALTRDSLSPHSTRLILMLPSLIYFISLNKKWYLYPIYLLFFLNFWHIYTIHYPQNSAPYWHTNMKEAVLSTKKYSSSSIYFSDSFEPFTPFFLFYYSYLPADKTPAASHITHFQNSYFDGSTIDQHYYFGHLNWESITDNTAIFVVPKNEFTSLKNPDKYLILDTISKKYLNSEEFYILKLNHVPPNK